MERVSREKIFSVSTLVDRIRYIRKEQKKLSKEKEQDEWEAYLNTIGQTPLDFGSKELDKAIMFTEHLIYKSCTEGFDSCKISFKSPDFSFFPSNEKLGSSEFATRFKQEAHSNLQRAFKIRNPDFEFKSNKSSYSIRFYF
jgi:hypothetical protein